MAWLISRVQRRETTVGQNKQYSAEVLAILLQSSPANQKRFIEMDGIDVFLQLVSAYRKRDPDKGTEEEEYVENIFDCVTCSVDLEAGKSKFVEAEGVELCLIMLREGKMSKPRALRLLDHALGGQAGSACCERLVEAAGLKTIFSMYMKKVVVDIVPRHCPTDNIPARQSDDRASSWHPCLVVALAARRFCS